MVRSVDSHSRHPRPFDCCRAALGQTCKSVFWLVGEAPQSALSVTTGFATSQASNGSPAPLATGVKENALSGVAAAARSAHACMLFVGCGHMCKLSGVAQLSSFAAEPSWTVRALRATLCTTVHRCFLCIPLNCFTMLHAARNLRCWRLIWLLHRQVLACAQLLRLFRWSVQLYGKGWQSLQHGFAKQRGLLKRGVRGEFMPGSDLR